MTKIEKYLKANKLINDHLETKGYPNITDEAVFEEIPYMYALMVDEGIIEDKKQYPIQHFEKVVKQQHQWAVLTRHLNEDY